MLIKRVAEGHATAAGFFTRGENVGISKRDKLVGFGNGKRTQKSGVDDGVDRGVGSDGEREGENRGKGERRALAHTSNGVAEVVES